MVRIYMFTVCLVLLLGTSTCVPVWAAQPSASYDYDAATHYDHSLDSDCQSTPPGCSYVALEHKTDCVHSESRTNNTGLFGILFWSSIIVIGYLSVSRDYDTPSNKFNNSPHRPNYDVRIEPRCTSTTTLKNEMSQYRAYFVPGGVDPRGTQALETPAQCLKNCIPREKALYKWLGIQAPSPQQLYNDCLKLCGVSLIYSRDSKTVVGYRGASHINCLGHASGQNASVQPTNGASITDLVNGLGFSCTRGISAFACQNHCKNKGKSVAVEVYVYVVRDPNSLENSIRIRDEAKNRLKGSDFLNDGFDKFNTADSIADGQVIDFHAVLALPDGSYEYQPSLVPQPGKTIKEFTPTEDKPEYPFVEAPGDRILDQMCCCK